VVELADQFDRTLKGMEVAVAVIADIHHASAEWAVTIEDIEFPRSEIGILGPGVRHPATSLLVRCPLMKLDKARAYTRNNEASSPLTDR
jgi:hypothetical protein